MLSYVRQTIAWFEMITLKDVATMAEVSTSTASRILHGGKIRVSETTRDRVLRTAEELSYRPNSTARSLRTRVTHTLGVLVTDVQNPLYAQMIACLEEAATEMGYSLLLMNGRHDDRRAAFLEFMTQDRVDGILVADASLPDSWVDRMASNRLPCVIVNRQTEGRIASRFMNDEEGAAVAIRFLVDCGHREIAVLSAPLKSDVGRRRMTGVRNALTAAGIPLPDNRWYECGFAGEGAAAAVDRLLWNKEPITAIAASGVVIAMLALKALLQRGVRVPEEISLIGFHDTPFAQYVTPGITTVRMPIEELARQAIISLVQQIEGVVPEQMMVTEPKPLLVVRQSVAKLEGAR